MTAALKTASEDFLRELSVVEATLDRLARKLEEEFAERYKGSAVGVALALVSFRRVGEMLQRVDNCNIFPGESHGTCKACPEIAEVGCVSMQCLTGIIHDCTSH